MTSISFGSDKVEILESTIPVAESRSVPDLLFAGLEKNRRVAVLLKTESGEIAEMSLERVGGSSRLRTKWYPVEASIEEARARFRAQNTISE